MGFIHTHVRETPHSIKHLALARTTSVVRNVTFKLCPGCTVASPHAHNIAYRYAVFAVFPSYVSLPQYPAMNFKSKYLSLVYTPATRNPLHRTNSLVYPPTDKTPGQGPLEVDFKRALRNWARIAY